MLRHVHLRFRRIPIARTHDNTVFEGGCVRNIQQPLQNLRLM
jgi:hypothetical protein